MTLTRTLTLSDLGREFDWHSSHRHPERTIRVTLVALNPADNDDVMVRRVGLLSGGIWIRPTELSE
jgi:hypothetical protein